MRFLLVKLNHIGDTLLLTPTLHWLRQRHPDAVIDVAVRRGCEPVLADNPDIDRLIAVARPERAQRTRRDSLHNLGVLFGLLRGPRYDAAFDLTNSDRAKYLLLASRARLRGINDWHQDLCRWGWLFNRRSSFAWGSEHQVLRDFRTVADILDAPDAQPGPLVLRAPDLPHSLAGRLPGWDPARPYVVLHPVSRWAFKEWLTERWVELATWLHEARGLQVVVSSGPDAREVAVAREIAARSPGTLATEGRLDLAAVTTLLSGAAAYIGIDTAVMHMAAALQVPAVALFGPSSEWSWRPWQSPHRLVLGSCECKQSRRFVCDKSRVYPCMAAIGIDAVKDAVAALLDGREPRVEYPAAGVRKTENTA